MATYPEYQQQPMASSSNDFTLYPNEWFPDQTYLPTTSYANTNYLTSTTFDSFPTQQSYSQQHLPGPYAFNAEQTKKEFQGSTSSYSPANSASHSFDYQQLPVLSSTSDSGASVQSTISSAMGSPSVQPQHANNDWNFQQDLSLIPGIAHHDPFATTGYSLETIPIMDKACVGELNTTFSSTDSFAMFPLQSANSGQHRVGSWESASDAMPIANCNQTPAAQSSQPALSVSVQGANSNPNGSIFKSPTTPESASSPYQPRSPVLERVKGQHRTSVALPSKKSHGATPLTQTMSYDECELPERPHAPPPTLSSPFFYQSSGYFVPPLNSSYPSLIQPFSPLQGSNAQYPGLQAVQSPQQMPYPIVPSPAPSKTSVRSPRIPIGKVTGSASPYMRPQHWTPYPAIPGSRRPSVSSVHSRHSQGSLSSDDSNKGLCPIATCGRHFKDLKAHMLTHQNERPEKCPIPTCEYNTKGFARKYDKNRHTLTHYKGTMVCGFCPGSGSAAEKSFNRADVFKRHLTSVHGVEQTPPNARRKSPSGAKRPGYGVRDVSGMCSTCSVTFPNAQDFYEHLDDCVLRVVQQADPSEAVNEKLLTSVAEDPAVQETMEKHMLSTTVDYDAPTTFNDNDDDYDEDEDADEDDANDTTYGCRSGKAIRRARKAGNGNHITPNGAVGKFKKQGLTLSKNGVSLAGPATAGKGSKRKKNYPLSWGAAPEKMRMKKRVMCVYDGQRRLWKDDMMLDGDHEVRIPMPDVGDGRGWTTDLDVQTIKRADAVFGATEEERGPWIDEDGLERLMQ